MHPNIRHFQSFRPDLVKGLDPDNYDDVLLFQDNWKVGDIRKVLYDSSDDYWKALVEPLPQFKDSDFPPFCSCAVFQVDMSEPQDRITKAKATHLAGLKDSPAFGSQSIYQGTCNDTLGKCTMEFSTPQSLFETQMKLSNSKVAALLSTDNPNVNVVTIQGIKKKKK